MERTNFLMACDVPGTGLVGLLRADSVAGNRNLRKVGLRAAVSKRRASPDAALSCAGKLRSSSGAIFARISEKWIY